MDGINERDEKYVSFLIRLWQHEQGAQRSWRGRVVDVDGGQAGAFEDAQGLLAFVLERLDAISSDVVLPLRRGGK